MKSITDPEPAAKKRKIFGKTGNISGTRTGPRRGVRMKDNKRVEAKVKVAAHFK